MSLGLPSSVHIHSRAAAIRSIAFGLRNSLQWLIEKQIRTAVFGRNCTFALPNKCLLHIAKG
jgi:hypothetical protein